MRKWKILDIGIKYNYGFYNGWFIKYKIWKIEYFWYSTERLIEEACVKLWIYKEDDMKRLIWKRFIVIDEEVFEDLESKFEIEVINKKINPDLKSIWFYSE
jgi:hypothetical protein